MNTNKSSDSILSMKDKTFTGKEIWNKPILWQEIITQVQQEKQSIISFFYKALKHNNINIVLDGAGTIAFIGISLSGIYCLKSGKHVNAISTTDHHRILVIAFISAGAISYWVMSCDQLFAKVKNC